MGEARQTGMTWQQAGLDPVRAFQVFGMRRSGNHAIIDWLMRNAPEVASGGVFLNNCTGGTDPLQGYATVDVYDNACNAIPDDGKRSSELRMAEAGSRPMIVVSYEDRMPLPPRSKARNPSKGYSDSDFSHRVIIYRSFLNWAASLLAKLQRNDDWGPVDHIRIVTRAFTTYADGLDRLNDAGVVGICYDDWMTSEDYRAERLKRLGLPVRDNSRGKMQRFGGGSSFQDKSVSVADLKSTSRADQMAHDPEYLMLLWLAGHDLNFIQKLMPHFEADVERIAALAENAALDLKLPTAEEAI